MVVTSSSVTCIFTMLIADGSIRALFCVKALETAIVFRHKCATTLCLYIFVLHMGNLSTCCVGSLGRSIDERTMRKLSLAIVNLYIGVKTTRIGAEKTSNHLNRGKSALPTANRTLLRNYCWLCNSDIDNIIPVSVFLPIRSYKKRRTNNLRVSMRPPARRVYICLFDGEK